MANEEGSGDGIRWFTVAHGALAAVSAIVVYMSKVVIDNSNRLAAIEVTESYQNARMDRQFHDVGVLIDRIQSQIIHTHDKIDDQDKRVEDRLQAQILLLQQEAREAERRAIEECRSIAAHSALPSKEKP